MDTNYRSLSPFGKAVACGSGAMQCMKAGRGLLGVVLLAETHAPRILNVYSSVEAKSDPLLLGRALAGFMVSDYTLRESVSHALSEYRKMTGRSLRGDR